MPRKIENQAPSPFTAAIETQGRGTDQNNEEVDSDPGHQSPFVPQTQKFEIQKNVPRPAAFSWELDELERLAEGMREHGETGISQALVQPQYINLFSDLDKVAAVVGTKSTAQVRSLLERTRGLLRQEELRRHGAYVDNFERLLL